MKVLFIRKHRKKNIRDIIFNERAIKRAAKESIKDQKLITKKATELRTHSAR